MTHRRKFALIRQYELTRPTKVEESDTLHEMALTLCWYLRMFEATGWDIYNDVLGGTCVLRFEPARDSETVDEAHMWVEYPDWYLDTAIIPEWCRAPVGALQ